jgi:hypothetical protein
MRLAGPPPNYEPAWWPTVESQEQRTRRRSIGSSHRASPLDDGIEGDPEGCYIVRGPYTYSGEPAVRLETGPGRPGLVFLSALSASLARAAGRVALVIQAPNAPAVLDAEGPGD